MYRFRSIKSLLGERQELFKQEIFFSDVASLNDPMEGFRELFWTGDAIVWRNLFRHYLLCLEQTTTLLMLSGPDETLAPEMIPVHAYVDDLPTDTYKALVREIYGDFFAGDGVSAYIDFLASRNTAIERDELFVHLKILHTWALQVVAQCQARHGLRRPIESLPPDPLPAVRKMLSAFREVDMDATAPADMLPTLFRIQRHSMEQVDLIGLYRARDDLERNRSALVFWDFPRNYLERLGELTYPQAYVACFMEEASNSAVWAHYGDGHRGVCLKFRTRDIKNGRALDLHGIVGYGNGPLYDYRPYPFRAVNYAGERPRIDFFRNLGRLTVGRLINQWYASDNGERSSSADHLGTADVADWRAKHWRAYEESYHVKSQDWAYEKEHRLVLHDILDAHMAKEHRTLKYRFESLEAIIFGAKTSTADKIKIMEIIDEKCQEHHRSGFRFYQADHAPGTGAMDIRELSLLKIEPNVGGSAEPSSDSEKLHKPPQNS